VGAAGLSCFTKSGEKIWDYEAPASLYRIDDCYALNVVRDGVWCYYYTDFSIARIDSDLRVRCWNTKPSGARTLAAADQKVLLCGGYGDRATECHLLALEDGDVRLGAEVLLAVPREIDLTRDWVIGRDKQLHVFLGHDWYVLSLDSRC
jgi:hypothetical protein